MRKSYYQSGRVVPFVLTIFLALGSFFTLSAQAAEATPNASAVDEAKLIEKIKEAVVKAIRDEDLLSEQIDRGIERYIQKQRTAQAEAQARQQQTVQERAKQVRRVSPERDHIYGNPDAEISLIEYSDFECPYCKQFHATARELVDSYDGKVNWVYRHFPLAFHNPGAEKQAQASECASELGGNEAFWKYADAIYARTTSNGKGFPVEQLAPLAKEIGLDETQFTDCLNSGKYAKRVQEDLQEALAAGINGTPGNILLNNQTGEVKAAPGALPLATIKAQVEALLPQG